jgi:hypothetical protein
MDKDFAMIAGILFVVILLSLSMSSSGISGFYAASSRLIEYPYEGFSDYQGAYETRVLDEGFQEGLKRRSQQGFETKVKVEGFEGLQSGPVEEQIIGFMYNNDSNTTCKGYGYTTSKGNVCLSDADVKLLTTRGMNATGYSDQIGA